jgi:hypothetical protein
MSVMIGDKNLDEISPEEAKVLELEHIDEMMELFETHRLCDMVGRLIVAEYEFRGDKNSVWDQLSEFRDTIEMIDFTIVDVDMMRVRKERLIEFQKVEDSEHYHKQIKEATKILREQGIEEFNKVMDGIGNDKAMLSNVLHEQGMCLCFNNN